eukprot:scaffold192046_cov17-Tisochrysis_lutea.AAC.2
MSSQRAPERNARLVEGEKGDRQLNPYAGDEDPAYVAPPEGSHTFCRVCTYPVTLFRFCLFC